MTQISKSAEQIHDKTVKEKNIYPNLFQIITVLEDINGFTETEAYQEFVRNNLGKIINKCKCSNDLDIKDKYINYLKNASAIEVKHLLTFLKKYELMDFYTYYFPGRIYLSQKDNLTEEDIINAYKKELSHLAVLDKNEMEKDIIREKQYLADYNYLNYRLGNCIREAILNYALDKNKIFRDLYLHIESNHLKYVTSLLESYQINFEIGKDVKSADYILTIYLPKGKELETLHKLLDAYHGELQRFYHYGSSLEKLEEDKKKFVSNNELWIEKRMERR